MFTTPEPQIKMTAGAALNALLAADFFNTPRTPADIRSHWRQTRGYELNNRRVCIAVQRAFRAGKLLRVNKLTLGFDYVANSSPNASLEMIDIDTPD